MCDMQQNSESMSFKSNVNSGLRFCNTAKKHLMTSELNYGCQNIEVCMAYLPGIQVSSCLPNSHTVQGRPSMLTPETCAGPPRWMFLERRTIISTKKRTPRRTLRLCLLGFIFTPHLRSNSNQSLLSLVPTYCSAPSLIIGPTMLQNSRSAHPLSHLPLTPFYQLQEGRTLS